MNRFNHTIEHNMFGKPLDVLFSSNATIPPLKSNEILVKIKARTINPSDLLSIEGVGPYRKKIGLPSIPGFEGVGVVLEKGSEVLSLKEGERVVCMKMRGSWQDFVVLPAEEALVIPKKVTDNDAAQLCINPLTAWRIINEYKFGKNDIIIGNAANSTMGKLFAQFALIFGYTFIGIVRNEIYIKSLLKLGASLVVSSEDKNYLKLISNFTHGQKPNIGVEAVGGAGGEILIRTLKTESQLILYGSLSRSPFSDKIYKYMNEYKIKISQFHLRDWIHSQPLTDRKEVFYDMLTSMLKNKISLPVQENFKLSQYKEAIAAVSQPRSGKIIIVD
jgi:NADPH:quinone reductase-like Zn-dependent oxidoreductase